MSSPADPEDADGGVHLEATAYGPATINQAGRDQHFHYGPGVRRVAAADGDGADGGCPYPGLASFTAEQEPWFFGRDRLTADLLGRLSESLAGGGPVMVVAASGAGKSSLLRAGVLPKIADGGLTPAGSRHWPRVVFTPGAHPVRQAAAALLLAACPDDGGPGLPQDPGTGDLDVLLARAIGATAGQDARAVIVVDQFEELFRLCDSEDERGAFISWLCQAARSGVSGGAAALVACAVRADFYADCTRYPQLRQALQDSQVIVGAMSPDELRQAITCPADAAGLEIEPGLTELLLADLRAGHPPAGGGLAADDGAGRLPLLAHALQATWQQRHGSILTVDGYRAAGGIEHAIADSAERVYARLDSAAQREARRLFLRLVKIGDTSGEDIRRPVMRPDLGSGTATAAAVIDAYTASRLLTQSRDTVQITHEALLRAWPRLSGWLDEDRAGHLIRQRLEDDAADWDRAGGDTSLLYRGARTETTAVWASTHSAELTGAARDFLSASRRLTRRTRIIQRSGITALAVLALVTSVTTAVALRQSSAAIRQSDLATRQRDLAVYNEIQAEALQASTANPSLAAQLTLAAYRLQPTQDLASQLLSTENTPLSTPLVSSPSAPISSVAFSPDGRTMASANDSAGVQLWDVSNPPDSRQIGSPLPGTSDVGQQFTAFSPDGRILASSGIGGSIQLWDVENRARPQPRPPFTTNGVYVFYATFSPDGRIMAGTGTEGTNNNSVIQLWDLADPARPRPLGRLLPADPKSGLPMAFSPDGILVTIGNDGTAQLWDVTGTAGPQRLGQPLTAVKDGGIASVTFGPGGILATGDGDGTVQLWDVTDPADPRQLGQFLTGDASGPVSLLAFSADGHTLAAVNDSTIWLWNVTDKADPQQVGPSLNASSGGGVESLAFNPDGRTLASGEANGTIQLWNIPQTILPGNGNTDINPVAFSPDGRTLATVNGNGTIRLWNTSDQADPLPSGQLGDGGEPVASVAFGADGRTLAAFEGTSHGYGTIQLWDIATPAYPRTLSRTPAISSSLAEAAFSPDGRILAVSAAEGLGATQLWDVAGPAPPQPIGQPLAAQDSISSLAFSPDGRILADGNVGEVTFWDVANPADPRQLGTASDNSPTIILSMAFSPDGRVLATVTDDETVQLWNLANLRDPRQASQLSTITTGLVDSVAFSPDGTLATGDDDGTIQLWNVADLAHPEPIGQPLGGSTRIVSVAFSSDGTLASGTIAGETLLWNLNVRQAIQRICTIAKGSLTAQQWHHYIPQLPYRPPCHP